MKIGGIDVGTTGCKLTVYNEKGELLEKSYKEYEVSRKTGEHEIDAAKVFEGVKAVIKETAITFPKSGIFHRSKSNKIVYICSFTEIFCIFA